MKRGYLSEEERDFIFENCYRNTPKQLANSLDRSVDTIRSFIKRYGLICASGLNSKSKDNPFNLSEREIEVIELLAKGLSNEEIIQKLFISMNTFKTHLTNIYGKLDVRVGKNTGSELRTRAVLKWLGII